MMETVMIVTLRIALVVALTTGALILVFPEKAQNGMWDSMGGRIANRSDLHGDL